MQTLDINQSNGLESQPQSQNQEPIDFSSEEFDSVFKLWSKYEDIAMHSNELIIKLRVQALGGLTITGTITTAIFRRDNDPNMLKFLLPIFLLGWIAIYFLDIYYYNRLLSGAIKEIILLEEQFKNIKLSTKIEEEINSSQNGRYWFYWTIAIVLCCISISLWVDIPSIAKAFLQTYHFLFQH